MCYSNCLMWPSCPLWGFYLLLEPPFALNLHKVSSFFTSFLDPIQSLPEAFLLWGQCTMTKLCELAANHSFSLWRQMHTQCLIKEYFILFCGLLPLHQGCSPGLTLQANITYHRSWWPVLLIDWYFGIIIGHGMLYFHINIQLSATDHYKCQRLSFCKLGLL